MKQTTGKTIAELEAELAKARADAKTAEDKARETMLKRINALPKEFGVDTVAEVLTVIRKLAKVKTKRVEVTDEMRKSVGELVAAGKTGREIAKTLKISVPTVQNIKKALGLTKARKVKTAAVTV